MMKSLMLLLVAMVVGTSAVHQTPTPTPIPATTTATPTVPTVSSTATTMHPQCIMVFPPLGMLPSLMRGEFHQTGLVRYVSVGAGSQSQSMITVGIKAGTTSTVEYTYSVKSPAPITAGRRLLVHQTPVPTPAATTTTTTTTTATPTTITTMTKSEMLVGDWHKKMPIHGVRVSAHDCSFSGDIAQATAALKAMGGGDLSGNKIRGVHPLGSFAVGNHTMYTRTIRASARFIGSTASSITGTLSFSQVSTGANSMSPATVDINMFGLNALARNVYIATYHMGSAGCNSVGAMYNAPGHIVTQVRRRSLLVHQTPVPTPAPTPAATTPTPTTTPTVTSTIGGYATGNLSGKFGTLAGLNTLTQTGLTDMPGYIDVVGVIGRTVVITSATGSILACAVINEQ